MSTLNRLGFVLKNAQGQVVHDSKVSALSGKPVYPGCPLCAVPGTDGLFVRLLPREDRQISGEQRAELYRRAVAWRDEAEPSTPAPARSHRKVTAPPPEPVEPPSGAEE
jgi:hypothetical protein